MELQLQLSLKQKVINSSTVFEGCNPTSILHLVRHLVSEIVPQDDVLFRRGDVAGKLTFLMNGRLAKYESAAPIASSAKSTRASPASSSSPSSSSSSRATINTASSSLARLQLSKRDQDVNGGEVAGLNRLVRYCYPGETLGINEFFAKDNKYEVSIMAVVFSEIESLEFVELAQLIGMYPDIAASVQVAKAATVGSASRRKQTRRSFFVRTLGRPASRNGKELTPEGKRKGNADTLNQVCASRYFVLLSHHGKGCPCVLC
jgi:hypothetical protein